MCWDIFIPWYSKNNQPWTMMFVLIFSANPVEARHWDGSKCSCFSSSCLRNAGEISSKRGNKNGLKPWQQWEWCPKSGIEIERVGMGRMTSGYPSGSQLAKLGQLEHNFQAWKILKGNSLKIHHPVFVRRNLFCDKIYPQRCFWKKFPSKISNWFSGNQCSISTSINQPTISHCWHIFTLNRYSW